MQLRTTVLSASALLISLVVASCASTGPAPGPTPEANAVSVTLLTSQQVRSDYGETYSQNPFIAPGKTMGGTRYDFLVVRITVSAVAGTEFALLKTSAKDLFGSDRASYLDRTQFTRYIQQRVVRAGPSETLRENKIGWYYLPASSFHVKRGVTSYLIVFAGLAPIGNSVTIGITTSLAGKVQEYHIPVPPRNEE